jgi:hypothetical protein
MMASPEGGVIMLSSVAEGHIGDRKGDANNDLQARALSQNARAHAERIRRYVAPSKQVDELLVRAISISDQIRSAHLAGDHAPVSQLRGALDNALELLTTACEAAGLSDEARALGS